MGISSASRQVFLPKKDETMIASLSAGHAAATAALIRDRAGKTGPVADELYLDLGGIKRVRVLCHHPALKEIIIRHLGFCVASVEGGFDAVIHAWEEPLYNDFHNEVLGLGLERGDDPYVLLARKEGGSLDIFAEFEYGAGVLRAWDGDDYYFAFERIDDESLLRPGHLFVKSLYKILNTPSSSLVHGACVGVDGKGALLCARGGRGKSTLAVSAMLKGFEYVSDDYLILERSDRGLLASPMYSVIALSPGMRRRLSPDIAPAAFVADNAKKDKLVLNISAWSDSVRRRYPVRIGLFPEIADVSEPEVIPCSAVEKGKAITHMVHSTMTQMLDQGDAAAVVKLVNMLNSLDFYRILLSPDILGNVECLRNLLKNI